MKCNGPLRMFAGSPSGRPILPTASDSDGHLIMRTPNESEVGILHGNSGHRRYANRIARTLLIFRGSLDMIDDESFPRAILGFKVQAKLLLERREKRRP